MGSPPMAGLNGAGLELRIDVPMPDTALISPLILIILQILKLGSALIH
jgi:hypothetical protein